MLVINDATGEHHSRPAENAREAKEFMLEDMGWFIFYCEQEASVAKNDKQAQEWRAFARECKTQLAIANEIPESLIANSGLVLFVGRHVFQIRV